ncbi:hypothetical protein ACMYSL_05285 [Klebsiella sp. MISC125]|uniref:hypothetical protein n=1 Tax=Klebsiella sp. MISC125 TaxID=2755386 RepID=UPI003DA92E03
MSAGLQAKSSGRSAIAIGARTLSSGMGSIAIGGVTNLGDNPENETVATGVTPTSATEEHTIAIGIEAQATKANAVAIGTRALSDGLSTIAIGQDSKSKGTYSAAIGNLASTEGHSSVAFGYLATANTDAATKEATNGVSQNSTALGAQSKSATRSVAVGTLASAITDSSVAIGNSSRTLDEGSIAIGRQSYAGTGTLKDGQVLLDSEGKPIANTTLLEVDEERGQSVAVGNYSRATNLATAIGTEAAATGLKSTALGYQSAAEDHATAIGNNASAGVDSVAIGREVVADGYQAVAIGSSTPVYDGAGVEISRTQTIAKGNGAIALGAAVTAEGSNSVVIGTHSNATGKSSLAIGQMASSTGQTAVAIGGVAAKAEGHESIALGSYVEAKEEGSTALGQSVVLSKADGKTRLTTTKENGVEVGDRTATAASGKYSVAVGSGVTAQALDSIAMGTLAVASKDAIGGIAIGLESIVDAVNATAIGTEAEALGESAFAAGAGAKAEGTSSTAVGTSSFAKGASSTALGDTAKAEAENSLALGHGATARHENSVALGANSETGEVQGQKTLTLDGEEYTFAGAGEGVTSTVSVGSKDNERTISNVAAGLLSKDSTDAVNGSQLFVTNTAVDRLGDQAVRYDVEKAEDGTETVNYNRITLGGDTYNPDDQTGGTTIANVADGKVSADSSEAVNGSQLYNRTKYFKANSTGDEANAAGLDSVAIGMGAKAHNTNDVALGANSETAAVGGQDKVLLDGEEYAFAGAGEGVTSTVSVGSKDNERTISNVAAGLLSKDSTDAVNGSQLFVTNTAVDRLGDQAVRYDVEKAEDGTETVNYNRITLGGDTYNPDDQTGGTTIANVADGKVSADSSEAVNGSQLYNRTKYFKANSTGDEANAAGLDSVAIGMGAIAHNINDVALGANSVTGDVKGQASVEIDGETYTFAGAGEGVTSTVSVGSKDNERTISNVAAGLLSKDSTDAVNGSQLFATNTAIDTLADTSLKFAANQGKDAERKLGDTMSILGGGATENGETYSAGNVLTALDDKGDLTIKLADNATFESLTTGNTVMNNDGLTIKDGPKFTKDKVDVAGNTITGVADGDVSAESKEAVNGSQLYNRTKYFKANSTGDEANAAGLDSVAIGMGAIAHNINDVALGANSVTGDVKGQASVEIDGETYTFAGAGEGVTSTVSVGSKDNERTISNVAAGLLSKDSTEAVNGSQLFATNTAIDTLADTSLKFAANQGKDAERKLGDTMSILGGGATENGETYSAGNVLTALDDKGDLTIKLADNATFESLTTGNTVMNNDGLTIKDGPKFTKDKVDVAGNTITGVADGDVSAESKEAVNGSQLYNRTKYFKANSTGDEANAAGLDSVAIGMGAIAHNINDVALGANSVTGDVKGQNDVEINGETYEFAGKNATSTVSVGDVGSERTISNVAAGELSKTSTDAVNGSQLFATNSAVEDLNTSVGELTDSPLTFAANQGDDVKRKLGQTMRILGGGATENGETYSAGNVLTALDDKGDLTIKLADNATFESLTTGNTVMNNDGLTIKDGPKFTKGEIDVANNTIGNVADGVDAKDAVNVSQLNNKVKYFKANSEGTEAHAAGLDSVAIGMGAIANNANDVALGAGSVTGDVKGQASVEINGKPYDFAGANPTSTVSVGDVGSERTISNVAAGELSKTSTDAVNGSQLFATNSAVEDLNTSVGELTDSPLTFAANQGDDVKRTLGQTMRILGGGATENGETYSAGNVLTELDEKGDLTIKLADNATFESLTTGNTVMNNDGLTIKDGPKFTKGEIDVANNTIGNVADGVKDSDAVNLSQLKAGTKYFNANSKGDDSDAAGLDSVAIGMGAIAHNANDVALGAGSVTGDVKGQASVEINGETYAFAGANPTSTVSVGDVGSERTISNVAAGELSKTSTDAVNGSQLFATNTALENLDNSVGGLQDDALLWDKSKGAFSASHGDTTVNKITNVAAGELGEKSTDAVNGSQLYTTNQKVETNTTNIAKNTQNISNLGDSVENIYNTGTKYFHANSTGADSQALGDDSVAIGMGAIANNANDVALGAGSVTGDVKGQASVEINGETYAFAGANPTSTVSVGSEGQERTISNVAAGELSKTSTDAVNGSQLFATNTALENLDNSVGGLQDDALLWDKSKGAFSASHGDTTVNKITNVAAGELGEKSTDAVNGSQLYTTNQKVETNTTNIAKNTQNISNLGDSVENIYNTGTKYFHANSTGADSDAAGLDSVAIGMGAVANNANDVALGAGSVTGDVKGQASVEINGETYAFAGANATSTVSVGSEGQERTISNVAAGELSKTSTDAVNGSQLFATNTALENLDNSVGGLQNDALLWDADKGAFSASHGDTTVNKITNVDAGELSAKSTDAVNGSQLFATNQQVETNTTNISNLGDSVENIYNTGIKYFHANSTGADSQALGLDSVAIGMGAIANNANDVALGANSVTDAVVGTAGVTLRGTDYAFAGANPTSTVSVGDVGSERTITNVAAGRLSETSTDAVNGSQLYATNSAVENLHTSVGGLEQDALQWDEDKGAFSASHGNTTVNKITNVAAGELGEKSTDAVNGSQLYTTNQNVETNTTNIAQNTQNISNLGDTVENIYTTGTKYFHANSTGADSQALGLDSVAIGMGAVANNAGDIALGAGSLTEAAVGTAGVTLRGTDYAFAGANPTSTVSVGSEGAERTITNVAAGRLSETSTDAVNGSQLYATNTAMENLNIDVDGLQKDALLWDEYVGSFSASHGDTTVNKITNVAAGELSEKSTDAVNGSQLFATNQQVSTNTTNISNLGDTVENIYNTGIKYFHANSTGADSQALGLDSVAIGMGAVANNAGDIALGADSLTEAAVGTAGVTLRGTDYAFAGANPTSTLSVGSEGAERTITNVAAGRLSSTSTDAVNGSQLFATNTALENIVVNVDDLKGDALLWDENLGAFSASHGSTTVNKITNVAAGELSDKSTDAVNGSQLYATNKKVDNLDYRVTNIEENYTNTVLPTMRYLKVNSTGPDAVASGTDAIALGQGTVASGDNSIATGNGAQASGNGAIATGNNASASGTGSVAIGDNASVTASNSVALGSGSVADRDNTVSVGSAGNERQVTNVAAGTEDTDAVNVGQLKDATGNITNNVTNISDGKDGMFQVNNTSNYAKPTVTGSDSLAGGAGSSASGSNSMAVGTKSSASGENSVALGNGSSATAKNSVALGTNSVANRENSVSMGYSGGERQVTNVAAGTETTDAVNVGQLKQGVSESVNYTNKQFNQLKNMVNDQKDKLSAGIAGAMAMSSLPQPYAPGASMVGLGGGDLSGPVGRRVWRVDHLRQR